MRMQISVYVNGITGISNQACVKILIKYLRHVRCYYAKETNFIFGLGIQSYSQKTFPFKTFFSLIPYFPELYRLLVPPVRSTERGVKSSYQA